MADLVAAAALLVPEMRELLERRYLVLVAAADHQPVGRRALARYVDLTERVVRAEIDVLRQQGLIEIEGAGIRVSESGSAALRDLRDLVESLRGLGSVEEMLRGAFGVRRAVVVPGDFRADASTRTSFFREVGTELMRVLADGDVLAVSGGSTLAGAARLLARSPGFDNVTVVPTGGGLGDTLEIEANAVATRFAEAIGAGHRLLHLGSDLDARSVDVLARENPVIRDLFALIRSASVVIHGVGTAQNVMERRELDPHRTAHLLRNGAVGESLGYFFDANGNTVEDGSGVGMRISDLAGARTVILAAAGAEKATAIAAVLRGGFSDTLITDESAARAMLDARTVRAVPVAAQ